MYSGVCVGGGGGGGTVRWVRSELSDFLHGAPGGLQHSVCHITHTVRVARAAGTASTLITIERRKKG